LIVDMDNGFSQSDLPPSENLTAGSTSQFDPPPSHPSQSTQLTSPTQALPLSTKALHGPNIPTRAWYTAEYEHASQHFGPIGPGGTSYSTVERAIRLMLAWRGSTKRYHEIKEFYVLGRGNFTSAEGGAVSRLVTAMNMATLIGTSTRGSCCLYTWSTEQPRAERACIY
jgi:hypothetical protein